MPIDLKKVLSQIEQLGEKDESNNLLKRLEKTYDLFLESISNRENLLKKLIETESSAKAGFTFAKPALNETPGSLISPDLHFSKPHIVIATDGSQIYSNAHEAVSVSLVNIGFVSIPYYKKDLPVKLYSEPTLYNSAEEINPSLYEERISDEDLISYERTLKEIEGLAELGKECSKNNIPIVALLDGTLIHWHIEKFSSSYIELFIKRYSDAIQELKKLNIPVASIISNSRSNDLINMLKIYKCPYEFVDCKAHCSTLSSKNLPCNPTVDYKPILDRRLVEKYFIDQKATCGARTTLFKSNNKILNYYPDELKVLFFYINTGTEIARVELPYFVAKNKEQLELLHNAICLQFKVGFGYPVALSEAHLQAVVRKKDREVFYDLIKEQWLKNNTNKIKLSTKELKKRISFV